MKSNLNDVKNLTQIALSESKSIENANYNKQIVVIKDRSSGFISAVLCRNQSTEESWFHTYGYCHVLWSDDGGSFRANFTEEMRKLGIRHVKSIAYNSASNGGAERTVWSIKEFLKKENIKNGSQELLQELTFKVNNCMTKTKKQAVQQNVSSEENPRRCYQTQ